MSALFPDLQNKVVLITGATRGIGRGIALGLARQKAHVLVNYRGSEELAKEVKGEIESLGGKATLIKFDMNNTQEMKDAISEFHKTHEGEVISGLVNNAGVSKDGLALRLKEDDIDFMLNTNLKGTMMLTSVLSRTFLKAPSPSIVNISSIVGLMGNPSQSAYAASKAGMIGFTKSYAKEMAPKAIRMNAICPGFIRTDMTDALDDKVKELYLSGIPLKRFGESSEVAEMVNFLLSDSSSYLTGEVLKIDGGLYI